MVNGGLKEEPVKGGRLKEERGHLILIKKVFFFVRNGMKRDARIYVGGVMALEGRSSYRGSFERIGVRGNNVRGGVDVLRRKVFLFIHIQGEDNESDVIRSGWSCWKLQKTKVSWGQRGWERQHSAKAKKKEL